MRVVGNGNGRYFNLPQGFVNIFFDKPGKYLHKLTCIWRQTHCYLSLKNLQVCRWTVWHIWSYWQFSKSWSILQTEGLNSRCHPQDHLPGPGGMFYQMDTLAMTSWPWIQWPAIREFKMSLWRWQWEPQKVLVKISKTTTLHVHHPFWYISLLSLHDYDKNCLISRFIDNMNIRRISLALFKLGYFS